jgi:large subunit ribosomal protein L15e
MGMYQYIRESWKSDDIPVEHWRNRLMEWRKDAAVVRVQRPIRLDRARSLGYKAKQGYVLVRVRLSKTERKRPKFWGGRRPKHSRRKKVLGMNYRWIAEQRANSTYHNLEVLNSYFLAQDGNYKWFEVIMVDPENPSIKSDDRIRWIAKPEHRGRVYRGLTSAARKSRGLRRKGKGAEKMRPSLAAHDKRGKN